MSTEYTSMERSSQPTGTMGPEWARRLNSRP